MNSPQTNAPAGAARPAGAGDEINLLELLDVVLDSRWLIASVMAVTLMLGATYALFGTPIYQSNILIQVEDSKGDPMGSMLGQASSLFDIRSPASAEMQILRSRLVVDQAVENLRLDVEVKPRYLPLVGEWLAKRAKEPSNPGIFGMGGFVSGNEVLVVQQFEVPGDLEGKRFRVRLGVQGAYVLMSPDDDVVGEGQVGRPLAYMVDGKKGQLLISEAVGNPGAMFNLTRFFRLAVTEDLQKDLKITEEGKQSGVIRATLEGDDPREVARLLNEIGTLYVSQNTERKAAEAEKSLDFLGTFLPQLRKQMEESESKFNKFRNKNSTFDLNAEGKAVLDAAVKLQTDLLTLQQKRKELLALYTPEHFSIQTVDAQIASIRSKLDELNRTVKTLPDIEQELLTLTRDVKVNSELYVNLLNSSQQLRLVKAGKVGNVRIVDTAAVTKIPVKPQKALVLVLSVMLGFLSGLAVAFLRNSLRAGLKDTSEIEQHTGLHVFASVPHSDVQAEHALDVGKKVKGTHVLALTAPQEPAVESLRSLRTALQFAMLDAASNVILITGPTPGIGKSFTSVNLATVLGAANKRVLLIDADLRKGHLNQYFGLPRERGMSEVVSGTQTLEDALYRDMTPNVDFLSTGILPPNPAELLMSPATLELIQVASKKYDLVLIDTPPVLAASDTAILAPHAGAVFMVARAEITTLGELRESNKRLLDTGVKTKGVIFNGVNANRRRYGYGVGYKYSGYHYTNYKY
ncbi:polysaccharide biosynthesis tyrosine autokinase [Variovorax sp. J22R133]|uniref:polysaccharide biosynthesis tyrosine autokinase n=1 Tax=Variovorax brevis TaxID=3053503 RepID=UPI002577C535|nr:polysaccharide biosynthesis tyrosine autokinase [Variovorax sp. J22R133]MDM0110725.1 polysaccharide biosynthesis tyrosine autokinase [Variovorax sp. J22R133]